MIRTGKWHRGVWFGQRVGRRRRSVLGQVHTWMEHVQSSSLWSLGRCASIKRFSCLWCSWVKLFHHGRLYFYPPPSLSHSLWNIASAELWIAKCGSMGGWMPACLLAQRPAPMANSPPLHLFARRTHPNSIPTAISLEFNARVLAYIHTSSLTMNHSLSSGVFPALIDAKPDAFNCCQFFYISDKKSSF